MQPGPGPGEEAQAMARGGSGPAAPVGGAATFRLVEGATLTLPDGCTVTVRQGALELPDGRRLAVPEAGGSVTIERRVVRPDGRPALVRHTIRVSKPTETKPAEAPVLSEEAPAEVPVKPAETPAIEEPAWTPVEASKETSLEVPEDASGETSEVECMDGDASFNANETVVAGVQAVEPAEAPAEVPVGVPNVLPGELRSEAQTDALEAILDDVKGGVTVEEKYEMAAHAPYEEKSDVQGELPDHQPDGAEADKALTAEVLYEKPAEEEADVPAEAIVEEPSEITGDVPSLAKLPVDVPVKEPAEMPVDVIVTAEETAAVPSKVSAEILVDEKSDKPSETPTDVATDASLKTEAPAESETYVPAEVLIEELAEVAADESIPAEVRDKLPAKVPIYTPDDVPELVEKPDEVPVQAPDEVTVDMQMTTEAPEETEPEALAETQVEMPTESLTGISTEICGNVPTSLQTDIRERTPVDIKLARQDATSEAPGVASCEIQLDELIEVPPHAPTRKTPGVNAKESEEPIPVDAHVAAVTPSNEIADPRPVTIEGDKPLASASSNALLFSSTPKDSVRSIPTHAQTITLVFEGEGSRESHCDHLQTSDIRPNAEREQPSSSVLETSLSPTSAVGDDCGSVFVVNEPHFQKAGGKSVPESSQENTGKETAGIPNERNAAIEHSSAEVVHNASQGRKKASRSSVKEEEEKEEEEGSCLRAVRRLVHHDSLHLSTDVPRLRRRSDDEGDPVNHHGNDGKKDYAHLNDPGKKRAEEGEMHTKLNSILHKLGYGIPQSDPHGSVRNCSGDSGGANLIRTQQGSPLRDIALDGPEEPEPVSVPKVISYFESISPQRVESPNERRKWRSSDRSPSAVESPGRTEATETPPDIGRSQGLQPPPPRRVNFANAVQRVVIRNSLEPEEMEDVPVPCQEKSDRLSATLVQPCLKEEKPVVTTQPTRLTTILVQKSPTENRETPDDTQKASATTEFCPGELEYPETPQARPEYSSVLETEGTPSKTVEGSVVPPTGKKVNRFDHDCSKSELTMLGQRSSKEKELEPSDVADPSETTPLICSSVEESNQVTSLKSNAKGGAAPVLAEPLPRPSSAVIQGDLRHSDFPTSLTLDPTEAPDGEGSVMMTGNGAEGAAAARLDDPFIPEESAQHGGAVPKPSSWFENCLELCCCCWVP